MSNVNFINSIKVPIDTQKENLLKIQKKLENEGITTNNVMILTKGLTESEKNKLKQLYLEQIKDFNSRTEKYKEIIIKLKKDLKTF